MQTLEVETWVGGGDICGFLLPTVNFSGLSGGGVPSEGSHSGQVMGTFDVNSLESPSVDTTGGENPLVTVTKLRRSHNCSKVDTSPKERQVQPGKRDDTAEAGRGDISEGRINGV